MRVGERGQRGRRRGSADITACQGDISFAMNHGPEEDRGRRARQQDFSSFPPLKKKKQLACIFLCLFYFFFVKAARQLKIVLCLHNEKKDLKSSIFNLFHPLLPLVVQPPSAAPAPRLD